MSKLEKLLSTIEFDHASPISNAEIDKHEKDLGIKFGFDYRSFVAKYGCVSVGCNEIYGICGNNAAIPSAIHATKSSRKDPLFPLELIVIADDGSGGKFCVDSFDQIFYVSRTKVENISQSFDDFSVTWLTQK